MTYDKNLAYFKTKIFTRFSLPPNLNSIVLNGVRKLDTEKKEQRGIPPGLDVHCVLPDVSMQSGPRFLRKNY